VNEVEDERILCPEERASVVVAMALLVIRSKQSEEATFELAKKRVFDAFQPGSEPDQINVTSMKSDSMIPLHEMNPVV
jgi:hypothetical protein